MMIFSVRKWLERLRFLILFLAFTYFMVQVLNIVSTWITPVDRYREPHGKAMKVFHQDMSQVESESMKERLKLFYWYGE